MGRAPHDDLIRLFHAANQRLWRARAKGAITENDYRTRQQAIVDWLGERRLYTWPPRDSVLARGGTPIIVPLNERD